MKVHIIESVSDYRLPRRAEKQFGVSRSASANLLEWLPEFAGPRGRRPCFPRSSSSWLRWTPIMNMTAAPGV